MRPVRQSGKRREMEVRWDEQVFECPHIECGKTFTDRDSFRKHMRIHGPKDYVCTRCQKRFLEKSKLKRHLLVHTGERPFKCEFEGCGRSFSLDFNLKAHIRTHTGDKPFECPSPGCGKRFTQSSNLKAHLAIHRKLENQENSDKSLPTTTTPTTTTTTTTSLSQIDPDSRYIVQTTMSPPSPQA